MNTKLPNRLINEKSPYLLEHAFNPVDWYPWGAEAFTKAQKENKPIFLSIGYSTCHWCHVMAHESFEDDPTAEILNKYFVSIKVDREERPDLDNIYMRFVMAMTNRGGWPMSVFLTPQQKPFYGGTYYPVVASLGLPAFRDLLESIHHNWVISQETLRQSAQGLVDVFLQKSNEKIIFPETFTTDILTRAFDQFLSSFDAQNGGFGHSPKFPMGHSLSFLLRYWKNNNEPRALAMVEKTLSKMALGGIADQLAGGFHRYSTDENWQIPHFEKMIYDQALLAKVYLETFVAVGKTVYAQTARQILEYVLREMQSPDGGFFSAQDADSLDPQLAEKAPKKEGAFYIWSEAELKDLLSKEEFKIICHYFGIEQHGNALYDPHGEFIGKNILHAKHSFAQTAAYAGKTLEEVETILKRGKEKLFTHRCQRPRPGLDDKILTDYNGLMISSFAQAGRILKDNRYLEAAKKAAGFILKNLRRADGRLLHRYRDGQAAILAGVDDYAFFVAGLLDLFENSFDPQYLDYALSFNQEMMDLFWDENPGGLFLTPKDGEKLVLRPKEGYDGALPSGNSMAAYNLLRLYHLTGENKYLQSSQTIFKVFYADMEANPSAYTQMMMALQFYFGPVKQIVVAGMVSEDTLTVLFSNWMPQRVLIFKTPEANDQVERLLPLTKGKAATAEKTSVYICENQVCRSPINDINQLAKYI